MSDKLLSLSQVAEHLSVCVATVRREVKRGAIACCKIGGQIRISPTDLTAYIERNKSGAVA